MKRVNERCYHCGSWAITEKSSGEMSCKDCHTIAPAHFFRSERRDEERLDEIALVYAGMAVACRNGPPDVRDPFVQAVMAEMRKLGRPWLEAE